jgi:phosphoglycerate dehydrogenase-like enzyme
VRYDGIARIALPLELETWVDERHHAALDAAGGWRAYDPAELGGVEPPPGWCDTTALVLPWDAPIAPELPGRLPALEVVVALGTGVWDYLDVAGLTHRGVAVGNTPGYAVDAVAEHTFALLLALLRDIPAADRTVRSGGWQSGPRVLREVRGLCLGIVGLGAIGARVALLGQALGMRVLAHTPHAEQHRDSGVELVDLPTLLRTADVVSLHGAWRGGPPVLGRAELALMQPGSILLNTARGRLVDEDALVQALVDGHLGGAGLDVLVQEPPLATSPLLTAPRTVLSPHHAANTTAALARAAAIALDTLPWVHPNRQRLCRKPL